MSRIKSRQYPPLSSDPDRTQRRVAALNAYFNSAILRGGDFVCSTFAACRESHAGVFYEGQLPHVGRHYDLMLDGAPFRIVVVGQEYGKGPARVSIAQRTEMILYSGTSRRFRAEPGFVGRKPHMKGTTSLLRLLFGHSPGSDHGGEWLRLPQANVHLFDAFSLANFLLCSAVNDQTGVDEGETFFRYQRRGGQRGRASQTMKKNCALHFRKTLEILEPSIVIAQGSGVRRWMKAILDAHAPVDEVLPVERAAIASRSFFLATLSHPSAPSRNNWGRTIDSRTCSMLSRQPPRACVGVSQDVAESGPMVDNPPSSRHFAVGSR